jgi:hypothetical protein
MQRRGTTGRLLKGQRTKRPKARKPPIATSAGSHQKKIDTLTRELTEARERQTATRERIGNRDEAFLSRIGAA